MLILVFATEIGNRVAALILFIASVEISHSIVNPIFKKSLITTDCSLLSWCYKVVYICIYFY